MITAKKGSEVRQFTPEVWKEMPPYKYGWVETTEVPEEVKALQQQKEPSKQEGGLMVSQSEYDSFKENVKSLEQRSLDLDKAEADFKERSNNLDIQSADLAKRIAEFEATSTAKVSNVEGSSDDDQSGSTKPKASAKKASE